MTDNDQAIHRIEKSSSPEALFGRNDAEAEYRRLLILVHPDKFKPNERPRAQEAAQKLAAFFFKLKGTPPTALVGKWQIESPLCTGDIADLYLAQCAGTHGVLKIPKDEVDNALMEAESNALARLNAVAGPAGEFRKYLPKVLYAFAASNKKITVFNRVDGLSLAQIATMLPGGIKFRHIVWMMNRLLSVLGFIHRHGFVHGGVTPSHLLYDPDSHGLVLVGWCSAIDLNSGTHIPIMANEWRALYPREVALKWQAHPATDIFMAARSMLYAGEKPPRSFSALFEHCLAESPSARPVDAWILQERWQEAARQEFGEPKFVKLEITKQ